jgi:hypothetical protein
MVTLDQLLDAGDDGRDKLADTGTQIKAAVRVGVMWAGWAVAKLVLLVLWCVAAPFWAAGYITSRWIIPAGKWTGAAFMVGYEQGKAGQGGSGRAAPR